MNDPNLVAVVGRLTKDPVISYTQDQKPIAKFAIANNKKFSGKEKVSYFDVTVFGNSANFVGQYLKKGSKVHIQGELEQSTWQDQNGQTRNSVTIIGLQVAGLDPNPNAGMQAPQTYTNYDPYAPQGHPMAQPQGQPQGQPPQGQPPQGAPGFGQQPVPNPWG